MEENQRRTLQESIKLPILLIGTLWLIHMIQFVGGIDFWYRYMGIYPRKTFGLTGIFTAPLIHADFHHLINNSIPLFVLTTMIMYFYRKVALRSFFMIYLLTGFIVWLFARSVFHVGASGVVYGLVTFVLASGFFRRNIKSIILAMIVLFLYSGMFVGVLPNEEGISWESHLYGALVGVFAAYYYKEEIEPDEIEKDFYANEVAPPETYFLARDVFDKTKEERKREAEEERNNDWNSDPTY